MAGTANQSLQKPIESTGNINHAEASSSYSSESCEDVNQKKMLENYDLKTAINGSSRVEVEVEF